MRISDPRTRQCLQWWREQPFLRKVLFAISHFEEWNALCALDKAEREAERKIKHRIFGSNQEQS